LASLSIKYDPANNAIARVARDSGARPRPPLAQRVYDGLKGGFQTLDRFSRLHDRFILDDRRQASSVVVCVLAGYKPELWSFVIPRLRRALPETDVCVVSPGRRVKDLADLCHGEGWSYLSTATNDVSLAQNLCYSLHPAASMIVKVDEDIFLLPDTIKTLLAEYRSIKVQGEVDPGFVAPMIPLNGFCYRHLLESLGLLEEYEAYFGNARIATSGIPIQTDPAAARWIWEKTAPLSDTADRLTRHGAHRLLCPIQFSIGLIVFERTFWEEIGFLPVYRRRLATGVSTLGGDEAHICGRALEMSRPGVVTTAAVAGHFSFGPQYAALKSMLDSRPELFRG
jgi:hypothetical protein